MRYKVGQIVFFNGIGIFGKLIRFYNLLKYKESKTTHVGIITKINKNSIQIYEATKDGFVKNEYPIVYIDSLVDSYDMYIGETQKLTNVLNVAKKYTGIPYGWLDIVGIAINFLFKLKLWKITGKSGLICSEAVVRILYDSSNKKINFETEFNKSFDTITPMDIFISKFIKIKWPKQ